MELTLEQRQTRIEVAGIMKKREGSPLIGELTDGQGNFCAVGFMFELFRQKDPKTYFWHDGDFATITHHPDRTGIRESSIRVEKRVQEWLGVNDLHWEHIVDCNDSYEYDWDEIADELLTWGKVEHYAT